MLKRNDTVDAPRRLKKSRTIRGKGPLQVGVLASLFITGSALAQEAPFFNLYGTPGLIDMPSAEMAPDATLSSSIAHFGGNTRTTITFQVLPKVSASFRYSAIKHLYVPTWTDTSYYDRSFDIRYQVLEETDTRPAIAIGLQDFIGTGLYGGEYVVASKSVGDRLHLTGGVGWGRMGSHKPLGSTGTRPTELLGQGGIPTYDRWFRGDFAAFGGVAFDVSNRLTLKAEYSSDAYLQETDATGIGPVFNRTSPWNFGLDYRLKNGNQLSVYHMYGSEIGAMLTLHANPRLNGVPSGSEAAPLPVAPRSSADKADLGWQNNVQIVQNLPERMRKSLDAQGLVYEGMTLTARSATLRLANKTYGYEPEAIGRAARAMTRVLPGSIETFVIIPVVRGMAMSAVTLKRTDLERLEHAPAEQMLAKLNISDGRGMLPPLQNPAQKFNWSISPYMQLSVFDPDNPVRADFGLRAQAKYQFTPNLVLSGSIAKKLSGNLDSVTRAIPSGLPRVRTDYAEYSKQGDPALEHLTLTGFGRPAKNLYSRLTAGYLETLYAGVSGELLWKPVDSRLALGAELNWVRPRDFDQQFGLRSRTTSSGTIPQFNGHISAYYDLGNGFHTQVDLGSYLAGDIGATVSLDREFANGWRVGAYASFTDANIDDFGEGSFDKGIRVTLPLEWALGKPSRKANTVTIQSLTRDGGARLNVNDRLYPMVRDYHRPDLAREWGRFWR
jgi:hypothetical protein